MDEYGTNNRVELRGHPAGAPAFSHESRGERFYKLPLEVSRLSGAVDVINLIVRGELLATAAVYPDVGVPEALYVLGELRSFNNRGGEGSRLVITVFARELRFEDGEDMNRVLLSGTLCKQPNLRVTPMGRDICDLMLAVNRRYGRSDYLPCIAWGLRAREAAEWSVGTTVALEGRIQSRRYIKATEDGPLEKTAFEVSVMDIFPSEP